MERERRKLPRTRVKNSSRKKLLLKSWRWQESKVVSFCWKTKEQRWRQLLTFCRTQARFLLCIVQCAEKQVERGQNGAGEGCTTLLHCWVRHYLEGRNWLQWPKWNREGTTCGHSHTLSHSMNHSSDHYWTKQCLKQQCLFHNPGCRDSHTHKPHLHKFHYQIHQSKRVALIGDNQLTSSKFHP